jgi:glycosyltransferase involved in cell wall biosynthesis
MRVLWYWPHPHRVPSHVALQLIESGVDVTVEALQTFDGDRLPTDFAEYRLVRDLPDVHRRVTQPVLRVLDRSIVHARRARRRHVLALTDDFDVMHVQTASQLDAVSLDRDRAHAAICLVVHDVTPHAPRLPDALQRAALRRIYGAVDHFVVFHETLRDRLATEFDVRPDRVSVIPHPLPPVMPSSHRSTDGAPTVLFFGSLRANKGLDTLLDTIERMPPGVARFVIAGGGTPDLAAKVAQAARTLPDLTCELGFIDEPRKAALLGAADVMVLPYSPDFESQSGVLFDAYAYGIPVVVTDVGAIGPTVRSDASGWVAPPNDPAALADALVAAASSTEARVAAIGKINAARERHSSVAVSALLRGAYQAAIEARTRR